ncbi:hypothetical protein NPIL_381551 [Nephila pilipes]|uniref:Uncharacterized protein n=1 Tax=Nephila pilipes TaxID=299642 RepID=A0A8X6TJ92_NEPPI|nr:hypothetical protein NPIL_381551 [Nephila pilipes]
MVTEAIKYYILSTCFKEKQLKKEIPLHTKEHNLNDQLAAPKVFPELTSLQQYQIKLDETTPKAHSEIICNSLSTKVQFSTLEKSNNLIVKHSRELKQKTPPVVHSVFVYKICVALNLDAQLCPLKTGCTSITDMQQKTITKKNFPKLHSIFIYKIFRALDLKAVLQPLQQ